MARNHAVVNSIHQIRFEELAALLPRLRPFNDYPHEIRRQFSRWALSQRVEFGSWQAVWNRWTGATTNTPGRISFHMRCLKCHGRRFARQHGGWGRAWTVEVEVRLLSAPLRCTFPPSLERNPDMSNWQGTVWKRKKDGMKARVLSDSSHATTSRPSACLEHRFRETVLDVPQRA